MANAPLEPGILLAGRYRLLRAVTPEGAPTRLWRATDEVLARPVAVKTLASAEAVPRFLAAAGRAGTLGHPGLARVYDAAIEQPAGAAYVISEWVEGRTLSDVLLAEGAMPAGEAVRLIREAADALGAAHARGVTHDRIHPGNLLLAADGRLRITDVAVAAAVVGADPGGAPAEHVGPLREATDTRDLAAVLYALLTARWPAGSTTQPGAGVPEAPRGHAGAGGYSPRQVRAGVPRGLDALVVRALEPASSLATPAALLQALDDVDLKAAPTAREPRAVRSQTPARTRRALPLVLIGLALSAIAVASYQAGTHVGALPRKAGALDALVNAVPSTPPSGPANSRIDLKKAPVMIRDFDPGGSDGTEQPGAVTNAYDDDPSTAWTTDGYNTALFGGLKTGVGLLVDLGRPTVLASVKVGLTTPGVTLELRAGTAAGRTAEDYRVVARSRVTGQVATLTPGEPTAARYWLVWFTELARSSGPRYRGGIAEMVFTAKG